MFKILLTLLAIALFEAILYGIAVLSCMLACNGAELLAALLAIGGTVGDSFLLVYLLKVIFKKREHPNP